MNQAKVNSRLRCNGTQLIVCYLAGLLYRLGLRRDPPLETIVTLSSVAPDTTVRETAFKYLCDNLLLKYSHYNPDDFRDIAFIPAEKKDETCLEKPGNVRCFFSPLFFLLISRSRYFWVFSGKRLAFLSCRTIIGKLLSLN